MTEVPKVTGLGRGGSAFGVLSPLSRGADQTVGHQTEPKVHCHAQVGFKGLVTGYGRKRRREDKVRHVA